MFTIDSGSSLIYSFSLPSLNSSSLNSFSLGFFKKITGLFSAKTENQKIFDFFNKVSKSSAYKLTEANQTMPIRMTPKAQSHSTVTWLPPVELLVSLPWNARHNSKH